MITIIDAIKRDDLFRSYLGDLKTWQPWMSILRATYGLPVNSANGRRILREVTNRDPDLLPKDGFDTALFLTGRRSGKSKIAAIVGAFEAALSGREERLSKGEQGVVAIVSPTKRQSQIVKSYLRSLFNVPALQQEIVSETAGSFDLSNGVRIEVMAGDWRSVRGYTLLAAIVDEICFMGHTEESKVKSDAELVRALLPALATCGGRFVGISSPYARKGWAYRQWKKHFGNDASSTLIVNCPSRTLNPQLPQKIVDEALAEDYASARAEYFGEWRDDVAAFLSRPIIEAVTVKGRDYLPHDRHTKYSAFVDVAGGASGGDDAALAIVHRKGRKIIVDLVRRWPPPHNPHQVISEMSVNLKTYGVTRCKGDRYSAQFAVASFAACGIKYEHSEMNRSELYLEALPKITSGEVELLDDERLLDQFANLERRTRSGGRDIVDHPSGGADDLCNACSGAIAFASKHKLYAGAFGRPSHAFQEHSYD
jgi:hypothetical protein